MAQKILKNEEGRIIWNQYGRNMVGKEINIALREKYAFDDFNYIKIKPDFIGRKAQAFHMAYGYVTLMMDVTIVFTSIKHVVETFMNAFETALFQ